MNAQAALAAMAFGLTVCLLGCAKPDTKAQAQKEIQKMYDREAAAIVNKDVNAALSLFASDYVGIDVEGDTGGIAEERKQVQDIINDNISQMEFTTTIHKITMKKGNINQATVFGTKHFSGTVINKASGKNVLLGLDGEIRDYWVKGSDGWKLKRGRDLSSSATLNGKPFQLK